MFVFMVLNLKMQVYICYYFPGGFFCLTSGPTIVSSHLAVLYTQNEISATGGRQNPRLSFTDGL